MNIRSKTKTNFLLLTAAGFLLRLFWIINIDIVPVSDFKAYQQLAISVFRNEPTSFLGFQGPGYPLTLGWFYKLASNTDIFTAKIFNFILSILTMLVLLMVFIKLFSNIKHVYVSYAVVVFLPNYIAYNGILATETLSLFLFSLILLLQLSELDNTAKYIIMGIVIGLSTLVKPYMIIYPVIVAVIYWLKHKSFRRTILLFTAAQLACICVIAPWIYRNYKMYKQFVNISYNNGYVMYINNNDQSKGGWMPISDVKMTDETLKLIKDSGYTYEEAISSFNPKLNKVFGHEAKKWIVSHPGKFSLLALRRVSGTFFSGAGDVFSWGMNGNNTNNIFYIFASSLIYKAFSHSLVFLLSAAGLIFVLFNIRNILKALFNIDTRINYAATIPVFNIAFFVMLAAVYEGQPRYNFNVLFVFAIALCELSKSFFKQIDISPIKLQKEG